MPGTVDRPDDDRALASLLSDMQRRLARLETQNRLRDATIDSPGLLRYRDAAGVVRFALGGFDNGGIGVQQYDSAGAPIAPAEQAQANDPRVVTSTTYADAGPPLTVTATAGPSGVLLIVMSALLVQTDRTVPGTAFMTFASTGGRVAVAQDINSLEYSDQVLLLATEPAGAQATHTHGQTGEVAAGGEADHVHDLYAAGDEPARPFRGSRVAVLLGCNPAVPTIVAAKYRVSAGSYTFDDRSLVVIPL